MSAGLVDAGQRELGASFVTGPLALGNMHLHRLDLTSAQALLETATEIGIQLLDTADIYGDEHGAAERRLGEVFAAAPTLRNRFIVATKAGIRRGVPYDSSATYLRTACEDSLTRLGVDCIDLFQIHRPDVLTHPGEVAEALSLLHEEGKIREVGVSNHTAAQTQSLQSHLPLEIATIQPEFSAACTGPVFDGVFDQALELGLTALAWGPLHGGRLVSGEGIRPELLAVLDQLAQREEVSRAAIAVAFVLAHPVSPVAIVGTSDPARLRELTRALKVTLERSDLYDIIQASTGTRLP
jgi:predicted oxidoreductase